MWRLFKLVLVLAVVGAAALAGYAYLGDMSPEQREMRVPVPLDR